MVPPTGRNQCVSSTIRVSALLSFDVRILRKEIMGTLENEVTAKWQAEVKSTSLASNVRPLIVLILLATLLLFILLDSLDLAFVMGDFGPVICCGKVTKRNFDYIRPSS